MDRKSGELRGLRAAVNFSLFEMTSHGTPATVVQKFGGCVMLCIVCGNEMDVLQSEPHDFLLSCEYYTLKCRGCACVEKRLLSRRPVPISEILASTNADKSSLPTPQEKIGRADTANSGSGIGKSSETRAHLPRVGPIGDLMKNPARFIDRFVRGRGQYSSD